VRGGPGQREQRVERPAPAGPSATAGLAGQAGPRARPPTASRIQLPRRPAPPWPAPSGWLSCLMLTCTRPSRTPILPLPRRRRVRWPIAGERPQGKLKAPKRYRMGARASWPLRTAFGRPSPRDWHGPMRRIGPRAPWPVVPAVGGRSRVRVRSCVLGGREQPSAARQHSAPAALALRRFAPVWQAHWRLAGCQGASIDVMTMRLAVLTSPPHYAAAVRGLIMGS
jgi:hypothetical protein